MTKAKAIAGIQIGWGERFARAERGGPAYRLEGYAVSNDAFGERVSSEGDVSRHVVESGVEPPHST
jgi:hypothetical protein